MDKLANNYFTFLFTNIEGSTKLWEKYPQAMRAALVTHDNLLHQAIQTHNGNVFKTIGDAFCAVFANPQEALATAILIQQNLLTQHWSEEVGLLKVRIALHTGLAHQRDNDYFGPSLNRVARLLAVTNGQQILLSGSTAAILPKTDLALAGAELQNLGEFYLKDLTEPEHIFQLLAPGLPTNFPDLKANRVCRDNLPVALTPFLGRHSEVAEVKALLATTRLLTLVGAGGVGKTRLARQVAGELLTEAKFKHGAWQVEFASLNDPALLTQTISRALGLQEEAHRPLLTTLTDFLRDRHLLLLLDNCEHLGAACAVLAEQLLNQCPQLIILATSRQPLNSSSETTWRVPSLRLPPPDTICLPEEVANYEALHFFVERARYLKSDFKVTSHNACALSELCRRLDGIPLALELAASRVKIFSLEQILTHLDNRFKLLTGGSRSALPRQQTLQALIDWSYDLLSAQEQLIWCYLAVFSGGWTVAAAAAVCQGPETGLQLQTEELEEYLTHLVAKSVLVCEQTTTSTQIEGEIAETALQKRYSMLETIRHYGLDRLEKTGAEKLVRQCHLEYFTSLVETTDPKLRGWGQAAAFALLESEQANIRTALDTAYETKQLATGLRLANATSWFWMMANYWNEGIEQLTRFLEITTPAPATPIPMALRARGLYNQGLIVCITSPDEYVAKYESALALARQAGDSYTEALVIIQLAMFSVSTPNDVPRWEQPLEKAQQLFEAQNDKWGLSGVLNCNIHQAILKREFEAAQIFFAKSIALRQEIGDMEGVAYLLGWNSAILHQQQKYTEALKQIEESINIYRKLGKLFSWMLARALINAGNNAWQIHDYKLTQTYLEEAFPILDQAAQKLFYIPTFLLYLASCYLQDGKNSALDTLARIKDFITKNPRQQYPSFFQEILNQIWERFGTTEQQERFISAPQPVAKEQFLQKLAEVEDLFTTYLKLKTVVTGMSLPQKLEREKNHILWEQLG